jgi:citrate lyase subunit alpha / citrate CoA-transferase
MSILINNAASRLVPSSVNGVAQIPYMGIGNYIPEARKYSPPVTSNANYPEDGNKIVFSLIEALKKSGIADGMTISTHHHFRDGDLVANQVFDACKMLGIKNLRWFPSASFSVHSHLIPYLEDGTIHHIEGSMNGPLGRFTSQGKMNGVGVLRSHGGRYQAIQDGEVKIDIAVIGASSADCFGNANGLYGPSACGLLGFALADSQYAEKVIVLTDNLVEFPCVPWQIQGNYVDFVVRMDQIGIPDKIISGTTEVTKSPDRLYLAELTSKFCEKVGIIHQGFSFQTGAGGTALAVTKYFAEIMRKKDISARFARGGSNRYLVEMLKEGLVDYILDGQSFDLEGIKSLQENSRHIWTSPFTSYNYHSKGNFAGMVDAVILGATELDLNFNGNVVTHSDGYLLHGIGGWQNCLFSKNVIIPVPLFRDRIPVLVDQVTTLCGPGELIDVIVTERGIAINPIRQDLIDKCKGSNLPIRSIEELKYEAEIICGKPAKPRFAEKVVAVVKWVDGTLLDSVLQVDEDSRT